MSINRYLNIIPTGSKNGNQRGMPGPVVPVESTLEIKNRVLQKYLKDSRDRNLALGLSNA